MNPVTCYTDYRAYLRDWIAQRKAAGLEASNRWFAEQVGVRSSSWLTSLLQGARGLSEKVAKRISKVIGHTPREAAYFQTLVRYNQAKDAASRNIWFRELQQCRQSGAAILGSDQHKYYEHWHHSVVRSLIGLFRFTGADYGRLAAMVSPAITPSQARRSVALLLKLKLVEKRKDGSFGLTEQSISTGRYVLSHSVHGYHQQAIQMELAALDRFSRDCRETSTITLGISEPLFEELRAMIDNFRTRAIELVRKETHADRVYQMNFHFFPCSKLPEPEKHDEQASE